MLSMFCLLDNIIFSLQRAGGASVVWQQHLERLLLEKNVKCEFIEYNGAENNIFRKNLSIPNKQIRKYSTHCLFLKRYKNLKNRESIPYIFHSSHYRTINHSLAINITTVHDFTYEFFVKGIRQKIHSWQKYDAIKKSQAIICISESTKKDLLHFLPSIDESRLHVIYNGVDHGYKILNNNQQLINLPFPDKEFLLYVGDRKNRYKNFDLVVKVCSQLKMPLILVGGGALRKDEISMLDEVLGVTNYYSITGVSVEILNEIYNRAFALIYPSLYEGFGIPVIEAQKAGCPVIAYANSSIPEIMGVNDYALSQISVDSVCEVITFLKNRPNEREKVIKEGIENSKRFSWDKTYQNTLNLYKKLYNEK